LLIYAKEIIENIYGDTIVDTKYGKMCSKAEYIYGDTDSVFFTFNFQDPDGKSIDEKQLLDMTIEVAKEAGHLCTSFLKEPHDLEYEKTFMPFCLLSKKRYVGMLYEDNIESCSRKSMGIVLKRRDNAPIVKDVYGGIIDILMKEKDIEKSILFLDKSLQHIVDEEVILDKLVVTKSLRSFYKNPTRIAHCVLANRMGARDNKPSPGDRIPYVYIKTDGKLLQGDKIETPDFIKKENLDIDYVFYITNQIMKPIIQIYSLVLYDMKCFHRRKPSFVQEVETLSKNEEDIEKRNKKIQSMKEKEVERLLFKKYICIYPEEMEGLSYQYRGAFDVCKKLGKNEKDIVNAILKYKKNKSK
jgi:DNA polymerase elongation subunit (family B)